MSSPDDGCAPDLAGKLKAIAIDRKIERKVCVKMGRRLEVMLKPLSLRMICPSNIVDCFRIAQNKMDARNA
jgi:hypothetical protein